MFVHTIGRALAQQKEIKYLSSLMLGEDLDDVSCICNSDKKRCPRLALVQVNAKPEQNFCSSCVFNSQSQLMQTIACQAILQSAVHRLKLHTTL